MGWNNEGNSTAHQKWNKSVKNVNDKKKKNTVCKIHFIVFNTHFHLSNSYVIT